MMLKRGIERGGVAYKELKQLARPMDSLSRSRPWPSLTGTPVGRYVAEMLEIIGTDGVILIEDHAWRNPGAGYVEGLQWDSSSSVPAPTSTAWRRWSRSVVVSTDVNVETVERCPSWSR